MSINDTTAGRLVRETIRAYLRSSATWAWQQVGKPYLWGAENDGSGFGAESPNWDCSEYTQGYMTLLLRVFRNDPKFKFDDGADNQYRRLLKEGVQVGDPRPGDLGFIWAENEIGKRVGHVVLVADFAALSRNMIVIEARGKPYSRVIVLPDYMYPRGFGARWAGWYRMKELDDFYKSLTESGEGFVKC
jgi:hypothetical protein